MAFERRPSRRWPTRKPTSWWDRWESSEEENVTPPKPPTKTKRPTSGWGWGADPTPRPTSRSRRRPTPRRARPSPTPEPARECPEIRERKEWRELSRSEKALYIDACNELNKQGKYIPYAKLHVTDSRYKHGSDKFLPWHRQFLMDFENSLRDLGGKYSCITLPYWDWGKESRRNRWWPSSSIFGSSGIGPNRNGCLHQRGSNLKNFQALGGDCVSRAFVSRRPLPSEEQAQISAFYRDFDGAAEYIERTLHGWPHVSIGGHMGSHESPSDPMFWIHHAFVDKIWALQQDCQGTSELDDSDFTKEHYGDDNRPNDILKQVGNGRANIREQINLVDTGVKYSLGNLISKTGDECTGRWPSFTGAPSFLEESTSTHQHTEESVSTEAMQKNMQRAAWKFSWGWRWLVRSDKAEACVKHPMPELPKNWCVMNNIPVGSGKCSKRQPKKPSLLEQAPKQYILTAFNSGKKFNDGKPVFVEMGKQSRGVDTVQVKQSPNTCFLSSGEVGSCDSDEANFLVNQRRGKFQFIQESNLGCVDENLKASSCEESTLFQAKELE